MDKKIIIIMTYKIIHASLSLSFINLNKKNTNKKEVQQVIITINIKYYRGIKRIQNI